MDSELPLEVRRALGWWRSTQTSRVFCLEKSHSRSAAWAACRKYGESIGVKEGAEYTGWRSNHTDNFWVWWAQDLEESRPEVRRKPALLLSSITVDAFISEAWEDFAPRLPVDKASAT